MKAYRIYYGVLAATDVSDKVLVLNPLYGNPIGEFGSRSIEPETSWRQKLEARNGFYSKLDQSIQAEGIRNPIFCQSITEGTFCRYGTTRLYFAKKYQTDIPCVIADYVDRWSHLEELFTEQDILDKYLDKPELIEIHPETMRIDRCPHYHLQSIDQ